MQRILAAIFFHLVLALPAVALDCGSTAAGFNGWKEDFASYASHNGVGQKGLDALRNATYSTRTIHADRNQKGVSYTLEKFIQIRLGSLKGFAAQGRKRLARNRAFFEAVERRFGVPAGVLIAIHGMETGFGRNMGSEPVISSISTVAYDCRRSDFFVPHALAALLMVDRGMLSPGQKGAFHGELGHTQFLPGNAVKYGVDGNGDGRVDFYNEADALASTANYLRQKGWRRGKGYLPGEPNFDVIKEWNAAGVYQKAIALAGTRIDG